MTAGRKTTEVILVTKHEIDAMQVQDDINAPAQSAELSAAFEETLELGKIVGRIEAADFYETVSLSIRLAAFNMAKKSKAYKNLTNPKTRNHFVNLEEFCQAHLQRSIRRMEQIASNHDTVGGDLFEKSEQLGLRQKDYDAIKALPSDDQVLIKRAMEDTNSREELIDLLQEMAVRNQKIQESMTQQLQSKDEVLLSKQKLVDYQADQIDTLSAKARFVLTASPSEKLDGIRTELLAHAAGIEGALAGKLAPAFTALKEHLAEHGGECDAYLSSALGQIERAVREIRESFGLLRAEDVAAWADAE